MEFKLLRLDKNAEDVSVPSGEVSIGRGPFLHCTDKKISRQHGVLQAEKNGRLTLTSVHANPCFYKKKGENTYSTVNEGDTVVLQDGDCFSLLPTSYQYKVVIRHDGREAEQLQEANSSAPVSPLGREEVKENGALPELNGKVKDYATATVSTAKKNRKLPKWMLGEDDGNDDEEKDVRNKGNKTGRQKRKVDESKPTRRKKAKGKENELSQEDIENGDIEAWEDDEKASKGSAKRKSEDETVVNNKGEEDTSKENEDSVEKTVEDIKVDRENEDGACNNENDDESTNEDSTDTKADKPQQVRPSCTYGAACYRKNPAHKKDFSHPGDPDYVDASQGSDDDDDDADDNRPECQYGSVCYRKNPDHRKQFKHTQNTQQAPKARAAAKKKDEVDDEEDDYDYNDPFLNDASSDDYQPTDLDSSETDMGDDGSDEDDAKRMMKEAKRFLRKKKKLNKA